MKSVTKDLAVFIQAVLIIVVGILCIMTVFIKQLEPLLELIIGLLLIVTGFNNNKRYKRKFFTIIYFVAGIALIAFTIFSMVTNGI